jgi:lysozyme
MMTIFGFSYARIRQASVALAFAGLIVLFATFLVGYWTPGRTAYPRQGIDVSHHQGEIQWNAVRADGVDFAYIKATEGADMRDEAFARNWAESKTAGLNRGAYHFFTLCRLASDQATNFIATVPREAGALPPVLDLEFGGNCASRPDRDVVVAEIASFIKMVEAHSETPVMLYMTREFDEFYRVSDSINRPLWLRRILFPPDYGARPWVMWQANPRHRVNGINGPVDWNVVRGDAR